MISYKKWVRFVKKHLKRHRKLILCLCVGIVALWGLTRIGLNVNQSKKEQLSHEAFIQELAPTAEKMDQRYHVPASISLAQAILESNWGKSELAARYNNLFGVKAALWEPHVKLETKEYENGKWITVTASFRTYWSWEESMKDHVKLMINGTDWNQKQYEKVIQAKDYRQAAYALQQAGYATDPTYAEKLISMIETYQLYRYDIHN